MKTFTQIFYCFCICTVFASCRKLVNVEPPSNQLTPDKIYTDSASVLAVLGNTYALLNQSVDATYTPQMGIYADELTYPGGDINTLELLQGAVSPVNNSVLNIWKNNYFQIYQCNDMLTGLNNYQGISASAKSQFSGEAHFLRALSLFYLVNTFGDVPLPLTTNVQETAVLKRTDSAGVYRQIADDLNFAVNTLPITYPSAGKARANKYAAMALLARVQLFQRDYSAAEKTATAIINSGLYTSLPAVTNTFSTNSKEAILQISTQNGFTAEASVFVPSSGRPNYPVNTALLNSFEAGDLRKDNWINKSSVTSGAVTTVYYYPYKYHNRTTNATAPEYLMLLRASEQYLIRCEARCLQNNTADAVGDLNVVRQRAGLGALPTTLTKENLLSALWHERQVEFFCEWGTRYLDLKRTGRITTVLSGLKSAWKPTAAHLPIPLTELNADPNLTQNPGY